MSTMMSVIHSPKSPSGSSRSWSPPSLHDIDIGDRSRDATRRYPAPPTGHDLMAFFPPQPPVVRPTPGSSVSTSGWFEQQERAFFSKTSINAEKRRSKDAKAKDSSHRQSPDTLHPSLSPSLNKSPYPSLDSNHNKSPITLQLSPQYPTVTVHLPANTQAMAHSPSHSSTGSPSSSLGHDSQTEDWRDNPDEAWRQPMPFSERRRAGKHTKRVIVRA